MKTMKNIVLICFLFAGCMAWAQKPAAKTKKAATAKTEKSAAAKEWDALDVTFAAVVDALVKKDKPKFLALSLKMVDCIDCSGKPEFNDQGAAVSADVFYTFISKSFANSPVYGALLKKGYTFSIAEVKDFRPKSLPKDYPKDLKLYEVWIPTYLKNELAPGNPGASHAFQFVKINGQFKFYGLISIP